MYSNQLLQQPPLSLYVHIPWCVRKCPYCDFNSHEAGGAIDEAAYVAALMSDLEQDLASYKVREVRSIFIGGGTPSLFSAASIEEVITGIKSRIAVAADAEITLEANPGTTEAQKLADFRSAGINRLSLGVQSFDDASLSAIGRIHDGNDAVKAVEAARAAGFDNLNLDLMFGLPGQSAAQSLRDMQTACELQPTHVSHYQLTIEANTWFHKHRPALPTVEASWNMQQQCHELLKQHGYHQYEVSAFSKAGKQSRHNLNYWTFGDYIGIGAGAHGKMTDPGRHSIERRWKHRQPAAFVNKSRTAESCSGTSVLDQRDILFEFLLNALRLRKGFSYELFEQRSGIDRKQLVESCSSVDPELLVISDTGIKTSGRGFDFLDDVLQQFLTV